MLSRCAEGYRFRQKVRTGATEVRDLRIFSSLNLLNRIVMKQLLLIFGLMVFGASASFAQCSGSTSADTKAKVENADNKASCTKSASADKAACTDKASASTDKAACCSKSGSASASTDKAACTDKASASTDKAACCSKSGSASASTDKAACTDKASASTDKAACCSKSGSASAEKAPEKPAAAGVKVASKDK